MGMHASFAPKTIKAKTKAKTKTIALACAIALGAPYHDATAITSTSLIMSATVRALPSCLNYEVRGVCVFITCYTFFCQINTSIRVRHYVPDAIVSTYNDPVQHPWVDVGKPIAVALTGVGSGMLGQLLDSSANLSRTSQEELTFKSVDVIANPVGMLSKMLSGGSIDFASSYGVPGLTELAAFPTQELPRIMSQWMAMPAQLGSNTLNAARSSVLGGASQVVGKINQFSSLWSGQLGGSLDSSSIGSAIGSVTGIDLGALKAVKNVIGAAGSNSYICPGSASAFTLHYQSDLDALFWRGVIPLEMLYPGSWIPGATGDADVTQSSPLINTWGGRYPRTGELVQPHPVKASAVLAERAASIVKRKAQPHIYKHLAHDSGGTVMFERQGAPRWQMVYPIADRGCVTFGANDSLSLSSFGDLKTSSEEGYIWNLWHRYDCCSRAGMVFLFSIP